MLQTCHRAGHGSPSSTAQDSILSSYLFANVSPSCFIAMLRQFLPSLQWGVLVNDSCGSGGGRIATLSLHQLVSGGKTSLAAEYSLPINKAGECCWNKMHTFMSMQCRYCCINSHEKRLVCTS